MIPAFNKTVEAKPHTAVYRMHRYFARRPWNVFSELISHYSSQGEIVLDPFCGGGVTVVESLRSKRMAVGVDLNPVATYVTSMQSRPLDLESFEAAFSELSKKVGAEISSFYLTRCTHCGLDAVSDWLEWNERPRQIIRLRYNCSNCGSTREKAATQNDLKLDRELEEHFSDTVRKRDLWFPKTRIPRGDKTDYLLTHGLKFFHELFTRRNLLALAILHKEIARLRNRDARDFLNFVLSSSLKWASRQSHLRGDIVEGWAMHAYWIYPRSLEINVWNTFERRYAAISRGKRYSNEHIGPYCRITEDFDGLRNGKASCLMLNRSATRLPIPNDSIDAVITDPPYGDNVNYAELSDYWFIWMSNGKTIEKGQEVIINRNQGKILDDYEKLLCAVFKECYRVLKPHRFLVSTFNSKDLRVVASFIMAASTAGFVLLPDGLQYQRPIRSYTTTFHAMQIGAFVGDFIFTFVKEKTPQQKSIQAEDELRGLERSLSDLIAETTKGGLTEPQLRERGYVILIPFLGKYARTSISTCREAVDFFEGKLREHEMYFRSTRERITTTRRQKFQKQQRA